MLGFITNIKFNLNHIMLPNLIVNEKTLQKVIVLVQQTLNLIIYLNIFIFRQLFRRLDLPFCLRISVQECGNAFFSFKLRYFVSTYFNTNTFAKPFLTNIDGKPPM